MEDVRFEPFRLRPGDDTSCLNLYQPANPRMLGVRDVFAQSGRFRFSASLAETEAERANPWLLLARTYPDEAIPVIADANSLAYVLHKALGDDIEVTGGGAVRRLRVVAALRDSLFQRELLIAESAFVRIFPEQEGYRFLLAETPSGRTAEVTSAIEGGLAPFGADVMPSADRLAEFHRVENTYLATFQMLGGLGLVLGTVGLATVLLRNVVERRRELALFRAVGYEPRHVRVMLLSESVSLLVAGLVIGAVAAAVATIPTLLERGGRVPMSATGLLLLTSVFGVGVVDHGDCSAGGHASAAARCSEIRVNTPNRTGVDSLMRRATLLITLATAVLGAVPVLAENWPNWRGPSMNGTSPETALPVRWSKTENIAWSLAMPQLSGSTPIIWGNHIFLNVAERGSLSLWAVDRLKGTVLWKRPVAGGDRVQRKANNSSPSPVTDGRTVWVMTGNGILKAFDFGGKELWARDIPKDYGEFGAQYGYGSSPLLHNGTLYLQVLHGFYTDAPSYVLKINGADGKTVWRVERPTRARNESPDAYTTPALFTYGTATEIVVTGGDVVTGHDPASGRELWRADGLNPTGNGAFRVVASPLVHGELLFAPSRERPLLALKPGGRGDVTNTHVLWRFMNGPDVPTPVTDGTYLYSINDRGIIYCLNAKTGAPPCTVRSDSGRPPTVRRRCWRMARSTSPMRTA